uniref:PDZ domain-containing protein n=1 Tax=Ditylenchus dipsaci TaxID=166011 RepID=A0A915DZQ3_9BILA
MDCKIHCHCSKDLQTSELYLVVVRLSSRIQPLAAGLHPHIPSTAALPAMETRLQLVRDSKNALGLSIVGGIDHCSHPFGTDNPGVFISKIANNSPASASRQLRVGDRILRVNGKDVEKAKHNEAVEVLKNRSCFQTAQRRASRAIYLWRYQLSGSQPADPTDEGIFIEHVEVGGCAQQCLQIRVGQRILEVNDDSLLGCTKEEAAQLLRRAPDTVRLLICDGFSKEFKANGAAPSSANVALQSRSEGVNALSFENGKPLATSSPIPPALPPKKSAEGIIRQREGGANNNLKSSPTNEATRFSTTLPISNMNSSNKIAPPTAPKPAFPQSDTMSINQSTTSFSTSKPASMSNQSSSSLTSSSEKLTDNHNSSTTFTTITQVHPAVSSGSSILSQRGVELQKKREWRNERMASLDAESAKTDELMNCVRQIPVSRNLL